MEMERTVKTGRLLTTLLPLLGTAPILLLGGCEKPPPPPPPPPPRKAPPPPPPVRVELAPLMRGIDARVQFPGEKAPYDASLAEAVIAFSSALASGDDAALGEMLNLSGRGILDQMIADGTWFDSTGEIEAVRVAFMSQTPDGADDAGYGEFVLAVQEPGVAYTLGWSTQETDGGWVMSPLETVDLTLPRAADWDGDSFGQYQSAMGWGGSAPLGADLSVPAGAGESSPVLAYLGADTVAKLMGMGSVDDLAPQMRQMFTSQMAGASGMTADEMTAMLQDGKTQATEEGVRPTSEEANALLDSLLMVAPTVGQQWTREQIIEAMAGSLGVTADEMQDIIDG